MSKKRLSVLNLILIAFMSICLIGCGDDEADKNYDFYYYTVNREDYSLTKNEAKVSSAEPEKQVGELIKAFQKFKDKEEVSPLPDEKYLIDWKCEEDTVKFYFSSEYYEIATINEAVWRSAVVSTLCQLEGINYVEYYVDDAPLAISGKVIGPMKPEDFVSGLSDTEATTMITLYFPDEKLKGLVKVSREVKINSAYTDEENAVKQLISGPTGDEAGVAGIPEKTKIKTIVTKDMVCYVTFSEEFTNYLADVPAELTIYSIVNTLCNLGGINGVAITIEGQDTTYYNTYNIENILLYNHDILLNNEE